MNCLKFKLSGRIPSKKNSKNVVPIKGKYGKTKLVPLSSKKYTEWHKEASNQIKEQNTLKDKLESIHYIDIELIFPDRRKSDLSNKVESILDLLVDCGILIDDNYTVIPQVIMRFGGIDKENCGANIEIYYD